MSVSDVVATVSDSGDLGVLKFTYQMSYTDPKGKKAADHGTSLTVLKKVNGQWKVLYDTNASEVAAP
jgi:ketosteroid isomerase-like protein